MVRSMIQKRLDQELYEASYKGDLDSVKKLLDQGADVDNNTPLLGAVRFGYVDVAKELLSRNANPDIRGSYDARPLHKAVLVGSTVMIKVLLDNRANINILDKYGNTPLMRCAMSGYRNQRECFRMLLEHGADYTIKNKGNMSVMDYLQKKGQREIMEIFKDFEATKILATPPTTTGITTAQCHQQQYDEPSQKKQKHQEEKVEEEIVIDDEDDDDDEEVVILCEPLDQTLEEENRLLKEENVALKLKIQNLNQLLKEEIAALRMEIRNRR